MALGVEWSRRRTHKEIAVLIRFDAIGEPGELGVGKNLGPASQVEAGLRSEIRELNSDRHGGRYARKQRTPVCFFCRSKRHRAAKPQPNARPRRRARARMRQGNCSNQKRVINLPATALDREWFRRLTSTTKNSIECAACLDALRRLRLLRLALALRAPAGCSATDCCTGELGATSRTFAAVDPSMSE